MVHFCCLYSFTWSLGSITVGQEAVILTFTLNFFVNVTFHSAGKLSGALWRRGGKRKESLQLRLWNLNICIEKVDAKCWLAEMTLVMTSLPLALDFRCLFTFALVSASRWLAEIWQLSRRGATGELEVDSNSRGLISGKCPLIFPLRRQNAPESLLAG